MFTDNCLLPDFTSRTFVVEYKKILGEYLGTLIIISKFSRAVTDNFPESREHRQMSPKDYGYLNNG